MGTNYYHYPDDQCPNCKRESEPRHIGKSSGGWTFGLHVIPEDGINSLADWERIWANGGYIKDEYGELITEEALLNIITQRGFPRPSGDEPSPYTFDFARNQAQPGPNNLVRRNIDGHYCVGHGEGTWDLVVGGFS